MKPRDEVKPLDDHVLAALLSGSLPEDEREEVLARLATDPNGRMLLHMAIEALEAAENAQSNEKTSASGNRRAA